jgi:hypothetical protein
MAKREQISVALWSVPRLKKIARSLSDTPPNYAGRA